MLNSIVALDIQGKGLCAEEPLDVLRAGRGGERAGVLVDTVGVQVSSQGREVQVAGLSEGARGGNIIDVGENGIEERGGVTELGELENKADNGNIAS